MFFPRDDALGLSIAALANAVQSTATPISAAPRVLAHRSDVAWTHRAYFHLSVRWAVVPGLPNTPARLGLRRSMAATGLTEGWPRPMFALPAREGDLGPEPLNWEFEV